LSFAALRTISKRVNCHLSHGFGLPDVFCASEKLVYRSY
jgi:hypothetical protein